MIESSLASSGIRSPLGSSVTGYSSESSVLESSLGSLVIKFSSGSSVIGSSVKESFLGLPVIESSSRSCVLGFSLGSSFLFFRYATLVILNLFPDYYVILIFICEKIQLQCVVSLKIAVGKDLHRTEIILMQSTDWFCFCWGNFFITQSVCYLLNNLFLFPNFIHDLTSKQIISHKYC